MTTMARTAWGLDTPTDDWRLHAACRGHDPEMWSLSAGYNRGEVCTTCGLPRANRRHRAA